MSQRANSPTGVDSGRTIPPVVARIARVANLTGVRLFRSSAQFFGLEPGEGLNEVDVQLHGGGRIEGDALNVVFSAQFDFRPSKESKRVVATISCRYLLEYRIEDAAVLKKLSDADAEAFASTNGMVNAWPYVREFCQSTLARMQLPNFVLPSLRVKDYSIDKTKPSLGSNDPVPAEDE